MNEPQPTEDYDGSDMCWRELVGYSKVSTAKLIASSHETRQNSGSGQQNTDGYIITHARKRPRSPLVHGRKFIIYGLQKTRHGKKRNADRGVRRARSLVYSTRTEVSAHYSRWNKLVQN